MSDPYNQYSYGSPAPGSGYPQPSGYPAQGGSPYPQGGSPYPQQGGYAPPQHQQSWGQQQQQQQQPGYDYSQQQQGYGAYGPPAHGGFQNGQQAPAQWGQPAQPSYNDPNAGYQPQPSHQFPQQGAYNSSPYPADPNAPQYAGGHQYGATDPNQAQEGDRGLLGAVGGGIAGHMGGKKYGHGLIGTVVGAVAGSKLEDKFKGKNGKHGHGHQQQGFGNGGKFW